MVSWTQIESAREALLKMARGRQLALPIAVEAVPKKKEFSLTPGKGEAAV